MRKDYDINKDPYLERYFEERNLSDETQKNYAKNLKKFCEAVDKELADIIDDCKSQQTIETEEEISSTEENGRKIVQRRIIKFDVNGADSLIKGYLDQFEKYCKEKGNRNTTISTGFDSIRAVLSEFNVELPNRKFLQNDKNDWNLLSKDDFQFVLADSSLMHKSLIIFMLSTGMRLSDALNLTIGQYMDSTSYHHNFVEVDDFIDNAPDDMRGFFDFEPQKTKNNTIPTRCITYSSPESNKFILQNLRRVKNEYLPKKFKNDPEKQKLKKSDSLFGSKGSFYKTSPIPQSISTMFRRKDKKLYEWHINRINQSIKDGKISAEDYDKYVALIPKFHSHGCRKYFCTIVSNHTANERIYRLMEGHSPKNKLDKSYIDFAKMKISKVYDDAVNDLSIYYSDEKEIEKIRQEFENRLQEKVNALEDEYQEKIDALEGRVNELDDKIDSSKTNIPFHRVHDIIWSYLHDIDEYSIDRASLLNLMASDYIKNNPTEFKEDDEYLRNLIKRLDVKIVLSDKDIVEQHEDLINAGINNIDPFLINLLTDLLMIIKENKQVMKRVGDIDVDKFDYVAQEYLVSSGIISDVSHIDLSSISEEDKHRIAEEVLMNYLRTSQNGNIG